MFVSLRFRVLGTGYWVLGTGYWDWVLGHPNQFQILSFETPSDTHDPVTCTTTNLGAPRPRARSGACETDTVFRNFRVTLKLKKSRRREHTHCAPTPAARASALSRRRCRGACQPACAWHHSRPPAPSHDPWCRRLQVTGCPCRQSGAGQNRDCNRELDVWD